MSQEWRMTPAGGIAAVVEQRQQFALFCCSSPCSLPPKPPQCLHPLAPLLAGKGIPLEWSLQYPQGGIWNSVYLICFLIFVLPLGKQEPRVNLCFAGRGTTCQDLFQGGFFAAHWGCSWRCHGGRVQPLCWAESWCQHFHCRALSEHVVSQLNLILSAFSLQNTRVN